MDFIQINFPLAFHFTISRRDGQPRFQPIPQLTRPHFPDKINNCPEVSHRGEVSEWFKVAVLK